MRSRIKVDYNRHSFDRTQGVVVNTAITTKIEMQCEGGCGVSKVLYVESNGASYFKNGYKIDGRISDIECIKKFNINGNENRIISRPKNTLKKQKKQEEKTATYNYPELKEIDGFPVPQKIITNGCNKVSISILHPIFDTDKSVWPLRKKYAEQSNQLPSNKSE